MYFKKLLNIFGKVPKTRSENVKCKGHGKMDHFMMLVQSGKATNLVVAFSFYKCL